MAVTVTDILATLRQSVYGPSFDTGATGTTSYRVPFMFTSRKRVTALTREGQQTGLGVDLTTGATPTVNPQPAVIKMAVNPETINWRQPKRITRKDTMDGAVFFHFNNSKGQNNDIITLDMKGTTGNINLVTNPNVDDQGKNAYLEANKSKLLMWHNLYNLTREGMLYQDNNGIWQENQFYIVYTTKLFPMGVRLCGFFSKTLEFEEHAKDPNKRNYSLSFTVTATNPDLDDIAATLRDYLMASTSTAAVNRNG
jgi:hypothetical protein